MRPADSGQIFLESILHLILSEMKNLGLFSESQVRKQNQKRLAKPVLSKVEGLNTTAPLRDA